MSTRTLHAIGKSVVASRHFSDNTTLVWHAGEPCVLPPEWYRGAIDTIEIAANRKITRQAIQTNATLLSDDWIAFIKDEGISLGVSLDGPEWINDARRVTRNGVGTFRQTQAGIAKLRDAEIPFHVIAVVTADALDHPVDFAQCLVATGAYSIGLNIEEIDGTNDKSSLLEGDQEKAYGKFTSRFMDTVEASPNPPKVREYERFLLALKKGGNPTRHMENSPGAIISVSRTGELTTFSPELLGTPSETYDNFVFADVHEISDVSQMFLNKSYLKALVDIHSGVTNCRKTCRYFEVCGGGSPSNKLGEKGRFDSTETAFCRLSVKATFDSFLERAGVPV